MGLQTGICRLTDRDMWAYRQGYVGLQTGICGLTDRDM